MMRELANLITRGTKTLDDGGAVDRQLMYGGTPLFYAVRGNQEEIVRELLESGADPNSLHETLQISPLKIATAAHEDSGSSAGGLSSLLSLFKQESFYR